MVIELISWYLLLVLLGWVTFPLTFHLLSRLSDRGAAFSRILGLLVWGFIFWILTSLRLIQNTPAGILFALTLVIGLSVWAGWGRWRTIRMWIKAHGRLILVLEIIFLACFLFLAVVRMAVPDATGTEKPMELAFINAVLQSDTFPPHDPWLAGYAISYYHFGYILAGMLAKITGTSGGSAFNLMLVSVFSLSGLGAYGILYNLLSAFGKRAKGVARNLFWALLGPLFLLCVSNLEGVLEVMHQAGVGWANGATQSALWRWINIESLLIPPSPPATLVPQRFWWWWQASRVVQDIDLLGNVSALSPIDEFPAFSFVLGDLHPHVLVMPFVMLVIGLALNVFLGGFQVDPSHRKLGLSVRFDLLLICAISLGGIAFLNTWDFPVYFVLLVGAFLLRRVQEDGWAWSRLGDLLRLAVPLGAFSILFYLPFFLSFQSQAGGILPNVFYPTRGLYLWLMFGALFVPIFLFLAWLQRKRFLAKWTLAAAAVLGLLVILLLLSIGGGLIAGKTEIGQQVIASQGQSSVWGVILGGLSRRLAYGVSLVTLAALMIVSLAFLTGQSRHPADVVSPDRTIMPFVLLMILLGGLMVVAPEFVYLRDNFGARMNTVFKFYYQAWMLWSLAAAFGAVVIFRHGRWISRILIVLVTLLGLVYPLFAYPERTNGFRPEPPYTLDAGAYLARYQPDEAAAIKWLTEAPVGVVAEAVGGQYSGYARVGTLSGQQSVLGWPGHEGQWRGGYEEVGHREADVRLLYEAPDWQTAWRLIQQYDMDYIYVGALEMSTYQLNLEKFDQNLRASFERPGVTIYEVP